MVSDKLGAIHEVLKLHFVKHQRPGRRREKMRLDRVRLHQEFEQARVHVQRGLSHHRLPDNQLTDHLIVD